MMLNLQFSFHEQHWNVMMRFNPGRSTFQMGICTTNFEAASQHGASRDYSS